MEQLGRRRRRRRALEQDGRESLSSKLSRLWAFLGVMKLREISLSDSQSAGRPAGRPDTDEAGQQATHSVTAARTQRGLWTDART